MYDREHCYVSAHTVQTCHAGSTLAFPHSRAEPCIVCLKQTVGPKIVTRVERGADVGHKTKAGEYKTKEKTGNQTLGKDLKSL